MASRQWLGPMVSNVESSNGGEWSGMKMEWSEYTKCFQLPMWMQLGIVGEWSGMLGEKADVVSAAWNGRTKLGKGWKWPGVAGWESGEWAGLRDCF